MIVLRWARVVLSVGILLIGCASGCAPEEVATPAPPTATPHGDLLPRVAAVASSETAWTADNAIDGSKNSRWSSLESEPEWIYVDLGDSYTVTRVVLYWFKSLVDTQSSAYGVEYEIQVSDDAENWTTVRSVTEGDGGEDDLTGLSATGRYVRMYGTRHEGGRFSIAEFEVYGEE